MLAEGIYSVKEIVDYGVSLTQKGNLQIFITFLVERKKVTWYGYFTEKTSQKMKDLNIKTLLICGFKGNGVDELANEGALNSKVDLEITVEHEEYKGKTKAKVAWVKKPHNMNKLSKMEAAEKVKGMNLEGDLMRLKGEITDDIPF